MKCTDCKHCNLKSVINYAALDPRDRTITYAQFMCDKYKLTPFIPIDDNVSSDVCCDSFEEDVDE